MMTRKKQVMLEQMKIVVMLQAWSTPPSPSLCLPSSVGPRRAAQEKRSSDKENVMK